MIVMARIIRGCKRYGSGWPGSTSLFFGALLVVWTLKRSDFLESSVVLQHSKRMAENRRCNFGRSEKGARRMEKDIVALIDTGKEEEA